LYRRRKATEIGFENTYRDVTEVVRSFVHIGKFAEECEVE
jgi:hypothetical protein